MHKTTGVRDPAAAFPLPSSRDDAQERREANRAVAVSAIGLAATGIVELLLAVVTGSVGLLGDAIHNLSDVSTSAVVFLGFWVSRKPADRALPLRPRTGRGPGRDRHRRRHLGQRRVRRVREHPQAHRARPHQPCRRWASPVPRRHRRQPGRRPVQAGRRQAHRLGHSGRRRPAFLAGCPVLGRGARRPDRGRPGFPLGRPDRRARGHRVHLPCRLRGHQGRRAPPGRRRRPECHHHRRSGRGIGAGCIHAHARARWTGRTLRVEIEGWVDPDLPAREADAMGRLVADSLSRQLPETGSFTWTTRPAPA